MEFNYKEMDAEERKQRFEIMRVIGAPTVYFYDNDEDETIEGDDNA